MVHRKRLLARNPEEQLQEVIGFLLEYGLDTKSLLYRVFNSDDTSLVLSTGTDRDGKSKRKEHISDYRPHRRNQSERTFYEEMGASSWDEMLGYDKVLYEMGLTRQDGLWYCRLDELAKNLDTNHDVVVPEKVSIAIYDSPKLVEIGVEFYAFREPRRKMDASIAVASDYFNK